MKNRYRDWQKQRLKVLRELKSLSQEEVSIKIGVKRCTYAAWEEGRGTPWPPMILELCSLYSITIEQFFEGCPRAYETC